MPEERPSQECIIGGHRRRLSSKELPPWLRATVAQATGNDPMLKETEAYLLERKSKVVPVPGFAGVSYEENRY